MTTCTDCLCPLCRFESLSLQPNHLTDYLRQKHAQTRKTQEVCHTCGSALSALAPSFYLNVWGVFFIRFCFVYISHYSDHYCHFVQTKLCTVGGKRNVVSGEDCGVGWWWWRWSWEIFSMGMMTPTK